MDVLQYSRQNTIVHRLNPVTKLLLLACFWIVAFISFNLFTLLTLALTSLILWSVARLPLRSFGRLVTLLSVVFVIFILINGFMYYAGETPLFRVFKWDFTLEGLIFGITISAKVLAVVTVVPLLTMTTPLSRFMAALARLRVPFKFNFTLGTAMRLTPLVDQTYNEIIEAQKLRGHDLDKMNIFRKIRHGYMPVFVPLILSLLRRAADLDVAIESRGFGAPVERTYVEDMSMQARDYAAIALTLTFTAAIIAYSFKYGWATPVGLLPQWIEDYRMWIGD